MYELITTMTTTRKICKYFVKVFMLIDKYSFLKMMKKIHRHIQVIKSF